VRSFGAYARRSDASSTCVPWHCFFSRTGSCFLCNATRRAAAARRDLAVLNSDRARWVRVAEPTRQAAPCPKCGQLSRRQHSSYFGVRLIAATPHAWTPQPETTELLTSFALQAGGQGGARLPCKSGVRSPSAMAFATPAMLTVSSDQTASRTSICSSQSRKATPVGPQVRSAKSAAAGEAYPPDQRRRQ
jgi:hypothetical protein